MMSTIFGEMGVEQDDLSLSLQEEDDLDFTYPIVMDTMMPERTTIIEQLDTYYDACSVHETKVSFLFFSFLFFSSSCIN
jgi:hypothetical protein